jgi:hypothetical protein
MPFGTKRASLPAVARFLRFPRTPELSHSERERLFQLSCDNPIGVFAEPCSPFDSEMEMSSEGVPLKWV